MLIKAQIQEFPNHLNRPFKLLYLQKAAYPSNAYKKKFLWFFLANLVKY